MWKAQVPTSKLTHTRINSKRIKDAHCSIVLKIAVPTRPSLRDTAVCGEPDTAGQSLGEPRGGTRRSQTQSWEERPPPGGSDAAGVVLGDFQ